MNTSANYNFGHEGQTVEFKTSFYVSAGSHGDDQQFVIFKVACSMMNAEGGIIYIGVDDNGNIAKGPHYGVRGDIEKIHGVCTNDAYVRYISQQIAHYFSDAKYVRGIMCIEETDSEDVIRIRINKADKVIYIHKKGSDEQLAYRREGPSSHKMNKDMIAQRESELVKEKADNRINKKQEKIRLRIQEAIDKKRKIEIYNYTSSNSDSKENRIVEPISFICDGRSLWAYEEKNEGNSPLRQFRLARIENVRVLDEDSTHQNYYKLPIIDAFEWARTTERAIHITITMGPAARNRLVEDNPESQKYLSPCGDNVWMLDTDVHDIAPVKRFCSEFKESITVYAPEELMVELGLKMPAEKEYNNDDSNNNDVVESLGLVQRIKLALGILMPKHFNKSEESDKFLKEYRSLAFRMCIK